MRKITSDHKDIQKEQKVNTASNTLPPDLPNKIATLPISSLVELLKYQPGHNDHADKSEASLWHIAVAATKKEAEALNALAPRLAEIDINSLGELLKSQPQSNDHADKGMNAFYFIVGAAVSGNPAALNALAGRINELELNTLAELLLSQPVNNDNPKIGNTAFRLVALAANYGHTAALDALAPTLVRLERDTLIECLQSQPKQDGSLNKGKTAFWYVASVAIKGVPAALNALAPKLAELEFNQLIELLKAKPEHENDRLKNINAFHYISWAGAIKHSAALDAISCKIANIEFSTLIKWLSARCDRSGRTTFYNVCFAALNDHPAALNVIAAKLAEFDIKTLIDFLKDKSSSPNDPNLGLTVFSVIASAGNRYPDALNALSLRFPEIETRTLVEMLKVQVARDDHPSKGVNIFRSIAYAAACGYPDALNALRPLLLNLDLETLAELLKSSPDNHTMPDRHNNYMNAFWFITTAAAKGCSDVLEVLAPKLAELDFDTLVNLLQSEPLKNIDPSNSATAFWSISIAALKGKSAALNAIVLRYDEFKADVFLSLLVHNGCIYIENFLQIVHMLAKHNEYAKIESIAQEVNRVVSDGIIFAELYKNDMYDHLFCLGDDRVKEIFQQSSICIPGEIDKKYHVALWFSQVLNGLASEATDNRMGGDLSLPFDVNEDIVSLTASDYHVCGDLLNKLLQAQFNHSAENQSVSSIQKIFLLVNYFKLHYNKPLSVDQINMLWMATTRIKADRKPYLERCFRYLKELMNSRSITAASLSLHGEIRDLIISLGLSYLNPPGNVFTEIKMTSMPLNVLFNIDGDSLNAVATEMSEELAPLKKRSANHLLEQKRAEPQTKRAKNESLSVSSGITIFPKSGNEGLPARKQKTNNESKATPIIP